MSRHVIGDDGGRDPILLQLPRGQSSALKKRTRLIGEDVDLLSSADGGADHAQRRAVSGSGECAGVAMREYGFAIGNQRLTVSSYGLADGDVFQANLLSFLDNAPH